MVKPNIVSLITSKSFLLGYHIEFLISYTFLFLIIHNPIYYNFSDFYLLIVSVWNIPVGDWIKVINKQFTHKSTFDEFIHYKKSTSMLLKNANYQISSCWNSMWSNIIKLVKSSYLNLTWTKVEKFSFIVTVAIFQRSISHMHSFIGQKISRIFASL